MLKIYAVKDNAIETYGNPFFVKAQGAAIRSFMDECKNTESAFNKHPADYDLYHLGEYNEETGLITSNEPERVARAIDYKE